MKRYFAAKSAYWSALFVGMSSAGQVWQVNQYHYPHESALDAMRGDWVRVGDDVKRALKKGDVKAEA